MQSIEVPYCQRPIEFYPQLAAAVCTILLVTESRQGGGGGREDLTFVIRNQA